MWHLQGAISVTGSVFMDSGVQTEPGWFLTVAGIRSEAELMFTLDMMGSLCRFSLTEARGSHMNPTHCHCLHYL